MPQITGFRKNRKRISRTAQRRDSEVAARQAKPGFKRLHNQVKESSDNNRQFFFAYLALMVFVQAMVIATTDKMLLLPHEGIKLPLVDLMVPLLGFYWIVPFFVLALHFNFLHNLDSHHYKLMQWRYAFPDAKVPRSRVHAFLFDFAVLERNTPMASLLHGINAFLCLYLGPVTLALVLWRMTDYQDAGLTVLHTLAFLSNCLLVWKTTRGFRANAEAPAENLTQWGDAMPCSGTNGVSNANTPSTRVPAPRQWSRWSLRVLTTLCMLFVLAQATLGIAIAKLSSEQYGKWFGNMPSNRPTNFSGYLQELMLPRLNIDPSDLLFEVNDAKTKALAELAGQKDWVTWFHSAGLGLDLRQRSLRGAQLAHQFLPRTLFEGSQMEGANFTETDLQGSNFRHTKLDAADFSQAKLQASQFWFAQLRGAIFRQANLSKASFEFAELNRVSFYGAYLFRTEFTQSVPQHADFRFSHLEATIFTSAQLELADFGSTQLDGAIFPGAQLLGTDFTDAKIAGAIFDNVAMQGVIGLDNKAPLLGAGLNAYSITPIDWAAARKKGLEIHDPQRRNEYLDALAKAQKRPPLSLEDLPQAKHSAVPVAWRNDLCVANGDGKEENEKLHGILSLLNMDTHIDSEHTAGTVAAISEFTQMLCQARQCEAARNKLVADGNLSCPQAQTASKSIKKVR
ncbi:MAG: pentapeptide repeat-containing protein [Burkholderiales bacterium]|nr:pentapeptide repeat-containing protein [Burkholderiales bacterium]